MTLRHEIEIAGLALQFLTRLPLPHAVPYDPDRVIRSVGYYPAVGLLVGAIGAAGYALGATASPWVGAFAALAATLMATGALHEDGLADTGDGLWSGADRARALEIMRDSRLGSFGALALIVVLGLKAASLAGLSPPTAVAALIAGHAASRAVPVWIIAAAPYARETGAKFSAPQVRRTGVIVASATALAALCGAAFVLGPIAVLCGLALGGAGAALLHRKAMGKIGGFTGDTLGACQQIAETGFYIGVLAWL